MIAGEPAVQWTDLRAEAWAHLRAARRALREAPSRAGDADLDLVRLHLDAALRVLRPGDAPAPLAERPAVGGPAPSPRQREIGLLVAEGWTNREIGAALYLSEKTVEKHLAALGAKLGVQRRAAVAARVAERRGEPGW